MVLAPLATAYASYRRGDPVPTLFNRHASVHAAGSQQYAPGNAEIALMLVTSVLRQQSEEAGHLEAG